MSTITIIQATDKLTDSRAVINTNFSNLNADKTEKSANLSDLADKNDALNEILPSQSGKNGKVLGSDGADTAWVDPSGSPLATNIVQGITALTVVAANPLLPKAVGDNDPRVPTQSEKDALAGTGTPSGANKFVTADTDALKELLTNKDTAVGLGNSDTKYPSQNAVKTYVNGKTGANAYAIGICTPVNRQGVDNELTDEDETITLPFQPRIIKLTFWAEGYVGGTGQSGVKGIAYFTGTTLSFLMPIWNMNNTYNSTPNNYDVDLGTNAEAHKCVDDTAQAAKIIAGDHGNNNGLLLEVTILSVSATGFVIRKHIDAQTYGSSGKVVWHAIYEAYQ